MGETKVVSVRLDEHLYALVERFARETNLKIGPAVARLCEIGTLLTGELGTPYPELLIGEIGMKVREIQRQDSNVNVEQLARRVRNLEETVRVLMKKTGLLGPSGAEFRSED